MKTMIEFMRIILAGLFPSEFAAAEAMGHNPLKGHGPNDNKGKSYFDEGGNNSYLFYEGGPCNADTGMPCDAEAELVEKVREDDEVRLYVYRLVPNKMVCEGMCGMGFSRKPTDSEKEEGVTCGYAVTTSQISGDFVVREIHGEGDLQLCALVEKTDEESTAEFTVAITHEPNGKWVLASAYPGRPDGGIRSYLANAMHYVHWYDKDDGVPPVKGFKPGDIFDKELLVDPPPKWIYDHVVDIRG